MAKNCVVDSKIRKIVGVVDSDGCNIEIDGMLVPFVKLVEGYDGFDIEIKLSKDKGADFNEEENK